MTDSLLRRTPYIVNRAHKVLICLDCKYAVDLRNATSHLQRQHKSHKIAHGLVKHLAETYPFLGSEPVSPDTVVDAIFGLAISPERYVVCARCLHGYMNATSWSKHRCTKPSAELGDRPPSFLSHVQTFFLGNRLRYFPIHTPAPTLAVNDTGDFTLFMSQNLQSEQVLNEVVPSTNYRELNQFLFKEGWIQHVANVPISSITAIVSLPERDHVFAPIVPNLYAVLSNVQALIASAVFQVRRLLGRRPS